MDQDLVQRVCCGNQSAIDFLANHWSPYVHFIDDVEDEETTAQFRMAIYMRAAMLYTHPFFQAHWQALRQVILGVTATYAQVIEYEKSPDAWKREWADHHRHCGMDMVVAIAGICGGVEHSLRIYDEQIQLCYVDHHNREGKAV